MSYLEPSNGYGQVSSSAMGVDVTGPYTQDDKNQSSQKIRLTAADTIRAFIRSAIPTRKAFSISEHRLMAGAK